MKKILIILTVFLLCSHVKSQINPCEPEFQVNTAETKNFASSCITGLKDGGYVICWSSYSYKVGGLGIWGQLFDSNGNKKGEEFLINTNSKVDKGFISASSLVNGGFVVCWTGQEINGVHLDVYAKCYNCNGDKVSEEFCVNSYTVDNQQTPCVTSLPYSGFIVCWTSSKSNTGVRICAQRFDDFGGKIGSEFEVTNYNVGLEEQICVTTLMNGNIVICWEKDGQDFSSGVIYGKIINPYGKEIKEEFEIITLKNPDLVWPQIASLKDGGFVVCWNSEDYLEGIFAQRYDRIGNKVNREFQVNEIPCFHPLYPCITGLDDGGFVISWTVFYCNQFGTGIFAKQYNQEGNVVGNRFRVNVYDGHLQLFPNVTELNNSSYVICWYKYDSDTNNKIVARYVDNKQLVNQLNEFELISPPNNIIIKNDRVNFEWQATSIFNACNADFYKYDLFLSSSKDFEDPKIFDNINKCNCKLILKSMNKGNTYYWKVLARNQVGDSLWSSGINSFHYGYPLRKADSNTTDIIDYNIEQNHPNPFNPETTIRYELPEQEWVEITVFDITGRRISTLVKEQQAAGAHSVRFDGRDLASGVYIYTIHAGDYRESKKMVLVR